MALDAAQILRQTYASGAERIDVASLMRQAEPQAVARGELMGTAVVLQEDPMAELMDSMEEDRIGKIYCAYPLPRNACKPLS